MSGLTRQNTPGTVTSHRLKCCSTLPNHSVHFNNSLGKVTTYSESANVKINRNLSSCHAGIRLTWYALTGNYHTIWPYAFQETTCHFANSWKAYKLFSSCCPGSSLLLSLLLFPLFPLLDPPLYFIIAIVVFYPILTWINCQLLLCCSTCSQQGSSFGLFLRRTRWVGFTSLPEQTLMTTTQVFSWQPAKSVGKRQGKRLVHYHLRWVNACLISLNN